MKKLFAAAVVTASATFAAPVFAQDMPTFTEEEVATATAAIEELALEDDTYRDLWCGAAFVAFNKYLESTGDTAGATDAANMSNVLFARVETALAPQALTQDQLQTIGSNASIMVMGEMGAGGDVTYSQEECTTAAQAE
jgi:hypothetical protein